MIAAKDEQPGSTSSQPRSHPALNWRNVLRLRTFGGLWVEGEDGSRRDGVRPRRLALLALLAAAGPKGRTRDQVLAVLWPESSPERARAVLSQTLYSLSNDLGDDVVLATTADLRLDPARLTSDIDEFRKAMSVHDWNRATQLSTGPFLDGFYLNDAPEFERWVEDERTVLSKEGMKAIERVARAASESGRLDEALEHWERLTRIDPLSSAHAIAYMNALVQRGDRTSALAHGQAHAEFVRKELETDPEPEVVHLLARLRTGGAKLASARESAVDPIRVTPSVVPRIEERTPPPSTPNARPLRRRTVATVITLGVVGLLGWGATVRFADGNDAQVLAVGQVRDLVSPDSAQIGGVLSEMLATSIGRLTQVQVIANSRLLELIPRGRDTTRAARTDAARRAGATQVLEGEVIPLSGSRLRFEVRRLDIQRGIVKAAYRIDGTDRMALFDSVAVILASDLGIARPTGSLAEASTRSPIAYRLYEEGLRALTQEDARTAYRLFSAAVREDSTFAMATYYRWRSEIALNLPDQYKTPERLLSLAAHAADRDRLLILTHIRSGTSDPSAVTVAESLITRFPNDPEGLVGGADALPDPARTIALLNHAIAIDSAAGAEQSAYCRLCEAFSQLTFLYRSADSLEAAEQAARRWMSFRPRDSAPWGLVAEVRIANGQRTEAEAAFARAVALGGPPWDEGVRRLVWSLRADDVEGANEECRTGLPRAAGDQLVDLRWLCTISLRTQGRFREALRLLRSEEPNAAHEAMLIMSLGDPADAAQRFLRIARLSGGPQLQFPGSLARSQTWNMALAATAFAEAGDTLNVRRLVDSVESTGRRSSYDRDRVIHHFLRGLILAKATKRDSAVKEFRAALTSPSLGYTRVNYELGKNLIALNRAAEAIPVLRAPLRGGLDGPGLYLTRTETHELLAKAFDATGQRDSAAAHYAIVERAWRQADPSFQRRYASARDRLIALGGKAGGD